MTTPSAPKSCPVDPNQKPVTVSDMRRLLGEEDAPVQARGAFARAVDNVIPGSGQVIEQTAQMAQNLLSRVGLGG